MESSSALKSAKGSTRRALQTLPRRELYFWLFFLSLANGLFPIVDKELERASDPSLLVAATVDLFGISAVVLIAIFIALRMLATQHVAEQPITKTDTIVAAVALIAALLPQGWLSWISISCLSTYLITSSRAETSERRAAMILLSVAGSLFWGRLLLNLLGPLILAIDAAFVANLTGVQQYGNALPAVDGSTSFIVANGCSSVHGMSVAVVLWVTMGQVFRAPLSIAYTVYGLAAILVTLALNVVRISLIVVEPQSYHFWHEGVGASAFSWAAFATILLICYSGAKNESFKQS